MKHRALLVALAACFLCIGAVKAQTANPTGTWKWTVEFNTNTFEQTLTLKLDGQTLTGSLLGRNGEPIPISNATFKEGVVEFDVVRERNGNTFKTHYRGTLNGDTIQGQTEMNFNDQTRTRDWTAKRA